MFTPALVQQRLSSLRGSNPPRGSEGAPRVALAVKSPPASAGGRRDAVPSPGREAPLEEGTATHSRILAWRTPGTEEAGGLQSVGPQSQTRLSEHTLESLRTRRGQQPPRVVLGHRPRLGIRSLRDTGDRVAFATRHMCILFKK